MRRENIFLGLIEVSDFGIHHNKQPQLPNNRHYFGEQMSSQVHVYQFLTRPLFLVTGVFWTEAVYITPVTYLFFFFFFKHKFRFQKYSIDEGEDAELVDDEPIDKNDEHEHDKDENVSDDSFIGTSSIEGEEEDTSVINKITKQLEPVIKKRVKAWPKKGIDLQLHTVDPSVSVDEWMKANQEWTTTTEKYKKTVVNEDTKTTTTISKHIQTTTKKTSLNSFVPRMPRFVSLDALYESERRPAIHAIPNDSTVVHTKSKNEKDVPIKQAKTKVQKESLNDVKKMRKLPVKIYTSRLVDESVIKKQAVQKEESELPTKMQSKQREKKTQVKSNSKSEKKISKSDAIPSDIENKRCLRSSKNKESILKRIQNEKPVNKLSKMKTIKKNDNQGNDLSNDLQLSALLPFEETVENTTEPVRRSRSPLKERKVNRTENDPKRCRNVKVVIEKMPKVVMITRKSASLQKNALEQTLSGRTNEMSASSRSVSNYYQDNGSRYSASQCTSSMNRSRRPQEKQIVIYSPNSTSPLGTKIDDKLMLVTKRDYEKYFDPKCIRTMNALNDSVVPINRRIIYKPPIMDTINESSDWDSDCDDDLLTTYCKTGHIVQQVM